MPCDMCGQFHLCQDCQASMYEDKEEPFMPVVDERIFIGSGEDAMMEEFV